MSFKAHFLNVGCADCTIFQMENDLVMIDCGYRRIGNNVLKPTNIVEYLAKNIGTYYIDLLIVSHPHHDHFLGMKDFIENGNIKVGGFWGTPYKRRYGDDSITLEEWNEYIGLKEKLIPDGQRRFLSTKGDKKTFGECVFTILGPRNTVNDDENRNCHDASLVIWASTPSNQILVCGDASDSELEQIRLDWNISKCTILRASHHGSINGANLDFIKDANPRDTIVSTKSGLIDNVPSDTALQRYRSYSKNLFRTDTSDTLTAPIKT